GKVSAAKVDLKNQNTLNKVYYQGVMRFWIYDTGGTGNNTDTRCGVFSNYAAAGDVGSMTYVQAVGITSSRIPTGFFYVYASSGFVAMDGLSTNTVANYVLTSAGLKPAPRVVNAWSNVIIGWNIDPVAKLLHSDYYVNPDFSSPDIQLNAMLDCDGNGSGTRFNAIKDVAGVFIGGNTAWPNPGYVDDISFSGDTMDPEAVQTLGLIPEPTGLMALGTGMIGLLGLIRRRK
ncbi:MAG: PEP-CTERM sorting domain-containing protein, partial [Armatimonadetes bacterium]|nr:PEP-CTERM sorting domain-containing protein [Armatimonadota bacterium]